MRRVFAVGLLFAAGVAAAEVPEGYTEVGGLTSTGSQYIYTDFVPSSTDTFEAKVMFSDLANTYNVWCARTEMTVNSQTLFYISGSFRFDRNDGNATAAGVTPVPSVSYVLRADYNSRRFSVNGVTNSNWMKEGDFTQTSRLAFFASHTNGSGWGNKSKMTLYYARIYGSDGVLKREYLPAVRESDGVAGLYETIEKGFFTTPEGTDAFGAAEAPGCGWTEEGDDRLVADVTGDYALTAEEAQSLMVSGRSLVKRGRGNLMMRDLGEFEGDIYIEEGILTVTDQHQLGKDNVGAIHICDGATLRNSAAGGSSNGRIITGKTVYLTGRGFGGIGAICGGSAWNTTSNTRFILTGDAYINVNGEFNFINYIDLAGHDLEGYQKTTNNRFGVSGTVITNSAETASTFTFNHGLLLAEGNFRFYGENNRFNFVGGSSSSSRTIFNFNQRPTFDPPVYISGYTQISGRAIIDNDDMTYNRLIGSLNFSGDVLMCNYMKNVTNTTMTLDGPVAGDGHWLVKPGWLNLRASENTFSGTIDVEGTSAKFRAGLRVFKGAGYAASKTTFTDADFEIPVEAGRTFGPLEFSVSGDYGGFSFSGGTYYRCQPTVASLRKSGAGTLDLKAGVVVTGRTEVVAGTIRFPGLSEYAPIKGYPGLMCGQTNVYDSTLSGVTPVFDTYCARGNELTYREGGNLGNGPRTTFAQGCIWNRSATTEVWSFKSNHLGTLWLWIDGVSVFNGVGYGKYCSMEMTPGAHSFRLYTTVPESAVGPNYITWTSATGSIYDALPMYHGGESTDDSLFRVFSADDGKGTLFTVDDTPADELEPTWLTQFAELAFEPGTVFDVGGFDYSLPVLEGAPTVANVGRLTVEKAFRVSASAAGSGAAAVIGGELAFTDGAEIDLADFDRFIEEASVTEALRNGFKFVTAAGGITGNPVLSETLQYQGATLSFADEGKSLVLTVAPVKDFRVYVDGDLVKVGAKIMRRPIRDVRIHIYRDGVEIAEKKLGAGYARYEDSWSFGEDGYYFVTADIYDGVTEQHVEVGSVRKRAAAYRYVSTTGNDLNGGGSESEAMASISAAVASLGSAGGYVYVMPGTYVENALTNCVVLTNAVQVVGITDDPSAVVVGRGSQEARIFYIDNAQAAIRMLTAEFGLPPQNGARADSRGLKGSGGNVWIGLKGGTVENCVLRYGNAGKTWGAGGGNIYLAGGRLVNSMLLGGKTNDGKVNQWEGLGGSINAFDGAVIENCLVTGCREGEKMPWVNNGTSDGHNAVPVGLYGAVKMVNCTVAGNIGMYGGAVAVYNRKGAIPQIVNCAFYDNTTTSGTTDFASVYHRVVKFCTDDDVVQTTEEEAMGAFTNCVAAIAINAVCQVIAEPGFVDAAAGDYRLADGSPLIDQGVDPADFGAFSAFDLAGHPRKNGAAIDLGAFEAERPPRLVDAEGLIFYLR